VERVSCGTCRPVMNSTWLYSYTTDNTNCG
jgi:hypothetical protein